MEKAFIYWDNSNIFHGGQDVAAEREEEQTARARLRINLGAVLRLAHAGRPVARVAMVGSIPPEVRAFWNRVETWGAKREVRVELFDRGGFRRKEQQVPDMMLQLQMMHDLLEHKDDPGVAVLLTGDGGGVERGRGFHADAMRMREGGWRVEVLSWKGSCSRRMRAWAEENGVFVPLDDYYEAVTFLARSFPGKPFAPSRPSADLDLSRRRTAK